jgi:DNA replication and repair protein RecF
MRVKRLEIAGVRNLASVGIECAAGLNAFIGENGAGKTAILEAIHILGRGRSFRSGAIAPVIQRGAESATIRALLTDEVRGNVSIGVVRHRSGRSEIQVDGRPERQLSAVARLVPIQLFLPNSSDLIFGQPRERRQFIDWGMFHVEPTYIDHLRAFQQALEQRNAVLRSAPGAEASRELRAWTEQLIKYAALVDTARRRYLERLTPALLRWLDRLSPHLTISVIYRSGWRDDATLEVCLRESGDRDVKFGLTHYGPHRADLKVSVGTTPALTTLSRGQGKVVASAFRLAQAEVTRDLSGRNSVFLIDDVGAELDARHNSNFFGALEAMDSQVFATATTEHVLASSFAGRTRRLFHVEQGSCRPLDTEG